MLPQPSLPMPLPQPQHLSLSKHTSQHKMPKNLTYLIYSNLKNKFESQYKPSNISNYKVPSKLRRTEGKFSVMDKTQDILIPNLEGAFVKKFMVTTSSTSN
jgi:hypothetical protein